jgi:hypothetical protein
MRLRSDRFGIVRRLDLNPGFCVFVLPCFSAGFFGLMLWVAVRPRSEKPSHIERAVICDFTPDDLRSLRIDKGANGPEHR